jgi:hypothetical protein
VYLHEKMKKENLAKQIAERDRIEQGLICGAVASDVSEFTFIMAPI